MQYQQYSYVTSISNLPNCNEIECKSFIIIITFYYPHPTYITHVQSQVVKGQAHSLKTSSDRQTIALL